MKRWLNSHDGPVYYVLLSQWKYLQGNSINLYWLCVIEIQDTGRIPLH